MSRFKLELSKYSIHFLWPHLPYCPSSRGLFNGALAPKLSLRRLLLKCHCEASVGSRGNLSRWQGGTNHSRSPPIFEMSLRGPCNGPWQSLTAAAEVTTIREVLSFSPRDCHGVPAPPHHPAPRNDTTKPYEIASSRHAFGWRSLATAIKRGSGGTIQNKPF